MHRRNVRKTTTEGAVNGSLLLAIVATGQASEWACTVVVLVVLAVHLWWVWPRLVGRRSSPRGGSVCE